jgi:hypothetical protein
VAGVDAAHADDPLRFHGAKRCLQLRPHADMHAVAIIGYRGMRIRDETGDAAALRDGRELPDDGLRVARRRTQKHAGNVAGAKRRFERRCKGCSVADKRGHQIKARNGHSGLR